jgi:RNA polymerase sigma factor (sigma-70 family)
MDRLLELIETLDVRRADILRMRYALDGNSQPMTLQEVGRHVNLTKERVRQIEKETIGLLRTLVNGPTSHSKTTMEAPAA